MKAKAADVSIQRSPVHRQLGEILRREIREKGVPGELFGSQNELAKRFGVSPTTVREAVNALVQSGLLERRQGSGTFVADPTAGKVVGILIEQDITCPGTSYYWLRLVQCLQQAIQGQGYACRLYMGRTRSGTPEPAEPTSAEFWDDLERDRLLGVVAVGTPHNAWTKRVAKHGVPLVSAEGLGRSLIPDIAHDMVRDAVDFMVAQGRRRLAIVSWGTPELPGYEVKAFRAAVARLGLETPPCWVFHAGAPRHSMAGWQGVQAVWHAVAEKPDGLLICSDLLVPSALAGAEQLRVAVPGELMVAIHGHREAPADPPPFPVLEMEVDPDAVAATLAAALVQRVRGEKLTVKPCRAFRLIVPRELAAVLGRRCE